MIEDSFKIDGEQSRKALSLSNIKTFRVVLVAGIKQSALRPRGSVPRNTVRRTPGGRFKVSTSHLTDTLERRQAGRYFRRGVPAELSGPHE